MRWPLDGGSLYESGVMAMHLAVDALDGMA
jgi:hypothetical protein